jgi:membrane glycosyltransferase
VGAPPDLPPECPIDMPVQRFDVPPAQSVERPRVPSDMTARRILLILLTMVLAFGASGEVRLALLEDGLDVWDIALLLLFLPLFGWVAFGFVGATIGFVLLMGGNVTGFVDPPAPRGRIGGRTAVLMPIYEEDVSEVFGRIAAMIRSIAHTPGAPAIDFFVLSDSGPAAGEREHSAWAALAVGSPVPLYYRRREKNVARKPGNLAEWVRRFGGAYDYMTVLDADSLMSGPAIVVLSDAMEARPAIGLIQTVPLVIGATTVFQRWMQFANRLYGPIASAGLLWWWGGEASFWGHNAIVRVAAFAESCGLPELPGKPPFGGHVMSHDIIEAALLRRRGWSVHTITVNGSYEEHPPTLVDHAIRDRRWAQGNIQHVPLLGSAGFHWISRLQMLVGASAYATSSLWLLLILTTLAQQFHILNDAAVAASTRDVLLLTIALLFGPKLMALIWAMSDPVRRQSFGGTGPLLRSVAAEIMLSILMAPVAMLTQTFVIVQILRGKRSDWAAQARGRAGIPIGEAIGLYRWHLALGAVFLLLAPLAPGAAAWLAPITIGLLGAPWLASWTSRVARQPAGSFALFAVPPEPADPWLADAGHLPLA